MKSVRIDTDFFPPITIDQYPSTNKDHLLTINNHLLINENHLLTTTITYRPITITYWLITINKAHLTLHNNRPITIFLRRLVHFYVVSIPRSENWPSQSTNHNWRLTNTIHQSQSSHTRPITPVPIWLCNSQLSMFYLFYSSAILLRSLSG